MKKILYITGICLLIIIQSFAQTNITSTIQVFPYQKTTEATASLAAMNNWEASEWKAFFKLLDDTAQKIKATYALHAYVNEIANGDKRAAFAKQLLKQKRKASSISPRKNSLKLTSITRVQLDSKAAVNNSGSTTFVLTSTSTWSIPTAPL